MKIRSIKAKLLTLIIVAFLVTIGSVIGLLYVQTADVRRQLTAQLDQSEYELYSLKLQLIVRTIQNSRDELQNNFEKKAGKEFLEQRRETQDKLLKRLSVQGENSSETVQTDSATEAELGKGVSLFILDRDGKVLMHPLYKRGSTALADSALMKTFRAGKPDHFTTMINDEERWLRWEHIDDWDWYVAYSVPQHVRYAGGEQVNRLMTQLNWKLALVMLGIALVAIIMQITLVSKLITNPILDGVHKLTDVAVMGDINADVDVDLRRRNDEIGQLARAVQAIIGGQRQQAKLIAAIADGDWTLEAMPRSDQDRLAHSLTAMIRQVNQALQQVRETAQSVDTGSSQIAGASQTLSEGATKQAASLEEITSSLTEMGTQTRNNAENATEANDLAGTVQEAAETGNQQMKEMLEAINEIDLSSQQISKIIKVIDDIAFQTNLLALNAAVEAARAGRHGRGFAVVADEVRNLAVRSAEAASETADLIDGARHCVTNGSEIADTTATSLQEIVRGINRVSKLVSEIAVASNEQAQGIAQINQGLAQVGSITEQNTANAEETASSAAELGTQVNTLKQLLSRFKLKRHSEGTPDKPKQHSATAAAASRRHVRRKRTLSNTAQTEQSAAEADTAGKSPDNAETVQMGNTGNKAMTKSNQAPDPKADHTRKPEDKPDDKAESSSETRNMDASQDNGQQDRDVLDDSEFGKF